MSDVKRPPQALRAHAARDFYRGFMTKNLVKGAGGGARGVDYQDFEADFRDRQAREKSGVDQDTEQRVAAAESSRQQAERDASEVVLVDAVQAPTEKHNPLNPIKGEEKRKKQQPGAQQDQESSQGEGAEEADTDLLGEAYDHAHEQHLLNSITKILADPTAEHRVFGALVLQDPEQMRKTLGTPIRVAKHLLVLAGRLMERGQTREQVVDYLAQTLLKLGPGFGGRAFKDFSHSIGIGSIYPLEVHEKLVQVDDKFLSTLKCRFTNGKRILQGKVKDVVVIEYPEDLVITGFAVKGGSRHGYQLAPLKEKGKHGLRFFHPGEYRVLLTGVDPMGFERLEEIRITVTGEAAVQPSKLGVTPEGPKRFAPSMLRRPPVPRPVPPQDPTKES
jgi:hypothetical protein